MNNISFYIKIFIFLLIFIMLVLGYFIFNIIFINKGENSKTQIKKDFTENTEFDIFNEEQENGEVESNEGLIDKIDIKIENIPNDLVEKIKNQKEFYFKIKQYIFLNGLISAKTANYEKYQIEENINKLAIRFKLDDEFSSKIIVVVDLNNGNIEVSQ